MNQLVVLEPRKKPLSVEAFEKLESLIEKSFEIKLITRSVKIPIEDDLGNTYRWEHSTVEVGLSLIQRGMVDDRLVESLKRPATRQAIAEQLKRLEAHKRFVRGGVSYQIIVEDLIRDFNQISEWALYKACDRLRRAEGEYFPSTNEIIAAVKFFSYALNRIGDERHIAPQPEKKYQPKPQDVDRARVAAIMHNAKIAHNGEFCEQCQKGG